MPDSIIGKVSVGDGATFTPDVTDGVISWTNNKNLPNPDPYDIVEKVLDEGENDLRDLVTAAQTAAGNAATSETNAHNSELAAAASAGNAATSATNAHNSELAAASSESNAATSEGNASDSADAAALSASAASDSADDAEAAAALVKKDLPLPIGYEYFSFNPNIPQGSLPLFGGEYARDTYSDLWAWVQTQTGYLKTEAEWQTLSASNNGNVPFYSDGDGSTTFRVPSLKCWIKGANGTVSEVGSYLEAGLPNITGALVNPSNDGWIPNVNTGLFASGTKATNYRTHLDAETSGLTYTQTFDASRANSIYGNANTVQPESIVGLWLVKAYGVIVDTGTIDEQAYIDEKTSQLQALVSPVGCVQAFAGNVTPQGWLFCDGSAVSRTTYANLFAVIGTSYGSGDGSTTFNLPNLVDKFVEGSATSGTVKSAGLPNITGEVGFVMSETSGYQYAFFPHTTLGAFTYGTISGPLSDQHAALTTTGTTSAKFDASRSSSIYGNSTTVQPPALTMRYIIKY